MHSFQVIWLLASALVVQSQAPATLRLVNLVYRHGDRSPVDIFPTDPNTVDAWPQGLGWLTKLGMQEQHALGQWLRQRYQGFLNGTYIHREIEVQSSDENRCLMSAYSNLAGLYPPSAQEQFDPNINWQPIPVHTRPKDEDNVLNLGKECPRYDELYSQSLKSDAVKKEEMENKAFYDFVSSKSGVKKENITKIWAVADSLVCERAHNMTWASWVNHTIFERLLYLEGFGFSLMFHGREESRLKGGPLLKLFVESMQKRAGSLAPGLDGSSQPKVYMYSAHDTTVAALLSALRSYNGLSPPYASAVLAELHQENGSYYVEISFKNTTGDPVPLTIPGCPGFKCPLDTFVQATKDYIPVDWDAECQTSNGTSGSRFNLATVIALSTACGVLLLILLALIVNIARRRRREAIYNRFTI